MKEEVKWIRETRYTECHVEVEEEAGWIQETSMMKEKWKWKRNEVW